MATCQKVTVCCEVFPEAMGGPGQYWYCCPKCGAGSFYRDVDTKNKYWPNEYEQSIENRIAELERQLAELLASS